MISKHNQTICVRSSLSVIEIPSKIIEDIESPDLRRKRDIDGNCLYEEVGKIDRQQYIDSFEKGCSLRDLLSRCQLLPTEQKIRYLNQKEDGVSADLSAFPKDGTEAFINLKKAAFENPEVFKRLSAGESFETVIKDIFSVPNETIKNDKPKEDNNNG